MRRRVVRYLFTMLTVFSLLVCVAVCVLWVRSYIRADEIELRTATPEARIATEWWARSNRGIVRVLRTRHTFETAEGVEYFLRYNSVGPAGFRMKRLTGEPSRRQRQDNDNPWLAWLGYSADSGRAVKLVPGGRGQFTSRWAVVEVPYWLLALLSSAPLLHKVKVGWPRRANEGEGVCASCGYDLRASGERCPACGTAKPDATAA